MKALKIFFALILVAIASFIVYYLFPYPKIPAGTVIDKIVVYKSKREMIVYADGVLIRRYVVAMGKTPAGAKRFEGDGKTPEGTYKIYAKNPLSLYHKNLGISYPNDSDIAYAKRAGRSPGGDVKIHGLKSSEAWLGQLQRWTDWTNGCIALTNEEMDELYDHTPVGTPIVIYP